MSGRRPKGLDEFRELDELKPFRARVRDDTYFIRPLPPVKSEDRLTGGA